MNGVTHRKLALLILLGACGPDEPSGPEGPTGQPTSLEIGSDTVALELEDVGLVAATPRDAAGRAVESDVKWISRNPAVVEATSGEQTSILTANQLGTAWIVAQLGELADSVRAVVTEPLFPSDPTIGSVACPTGGRQVPVSTARDLERALDRVQAGDVIVLASGRYVGRFLAEESGMESSPIALCGPRTAVIDGGALDEGGYALTVRGSYWRLLGFTVANTEQGVRLEASRHGVVRGLLITGTGQEALSLARHSAHNLIEGNTIRQTGQITAEWGEGIYLGSFRGHWCQRTDCEPDRTDSNTVRANRIGPDVRAELIDAKEGTRDNIIENNRLDGRGQVMSQPWIDSWIEINGDGYRVTENRGRNAIENGFEVTTVVHEGTLYGRGNVFARNEALVDAAGFGFAIDGQAAGTVVRCNNIVSGARAGDSSVRCTSE